MGLQTQARPGLLHAMWHTNTVKTALLQGLALQVGEKSLTMDKGRQKSIKI